MLRRHLSLALIALIACGILLLNICDYRWRRLSHSVGSGPGGLFDGYLEVDPNAWKKGRDRGQFKEPKVDGASPYPIGKTKPAGSNYTRTLVISKLKEEDTDWIQDELSDMLASGLLDTAIYTLDEPKATFYPGTNKGHEAVAYLSYIIDFYSNLPDIAIFMHAHRYAWHNNLILDKDSSLMVRHLSPERVTRQGYMNLRCHWDPGCPDWLRPGSRDYDEYKQEQEILAKSWVQLFTDEPLPKVLAQPCCAQFAVSRERIWSIPKERFVSLKNWILNTDLDDFISGRIFEYTWQYIFTASPFHCPSMSVCYCDGYGLCFGDPEKFDYYFELEYYLNLYKNELDAAVDHRKTETRRLTGQEMSGVPIAGRHEWLVKEISRIEERMKMTKNEAFKRGRDLKQRAREAGRDADEGSSF